MFVIWKRLGSIIQQQVFQQLSILPLKKRCSRGNYTNFIEMMVLMYYLKPKILKRQKSTRMGLPDSKAAMWECSKKNLQDGDVVALIGNAGNGMDHLRTQRLRTSDDKGVLNSIRQQKDLLTKCLPYHHQCNQTVICRSGQRLAGNKGRLGNTHGGSGLAEQCSIRWPMHQMFQRKQSTIGRQTKCFQAYINYKLGASLNIRDSLQELRKNLLKSYYHKQWFKL